MFEVYLERVSPTFEQSGGNSLLASGEGTRKQNEIRQKLSGSRSKLGKASD
jgi:hypothetical protein